MGPKRGKDDYRTCTRENSAQFVCTSRAGCAREMNHLKAFEADALAPLAKIRPEGQMDIPITNFFKTHACLQQRSRGNVTAFHHPVGPDHTAL